MTQNEILSHELLSFLSSYPQELKSQGHALAGKMAVSLGNAILALSYTLERGKPQLLQPINEPPQSLFALGKQFREVGLQLWDPVPEPNPWPAIQDNFSDVQNIKSVVAVLLNKVSNIEKAVAGKGGAK
jgi:hypothetical protein